MNLAKGHSDCIKQEPLLLWDSGLGISFDHIILSYIEVTVIMNHMFSIYGNSTVRLRNIELKSSHLLGFSLDTKIYPIIGNLKGNCTHTHTHTHTYILSFLGRKSTGHWPATQNNPGFACVPSLMLLWPVLNSVMLYLCPTWWTAFPVTGFSIGHVWMWELDYKESWAPEELMLLDCGVGEDSFKSLGLQGDATSPS